MVRLLFLGLIVAAGGMIDARVARAGEDCVAGVRALAPWTTAIRPASTYARDWASAARNAGFVVDHQLTNGAVICYLGNYGQLVSELGHVAVIVDATPRWIGGRWTIRVQDSSPGTAGWVRQIRTVGVPDTSKSWIIHPKR